MNIRLRHFTVLIIGISLMLGFYADVDACTRVFWNTMPDLKVVARNEDYLTPVDPTMVITPRGIVAGADAHTAFSDNEEFNYTGVHGVNDDTPKVRLSGAGQTAGEAAMMFGTPGATGVWAPENTRTEIYDAIKRKETFGTWGPLIRVRFFGGWDYPSDLTKDPDFVKKAYAGGVPMGGDLPKKPDSVNLDRVQIIKGWYKNGYSWEKVYDVAWSDGRKPFKERRQFSGAGCPNQEFFDQLLPG